MTISTVGRHVLVELYDCDPHTIDDVEKVRGALRSAAEAIRATVVGEAFHRFSPQGVSGVLLIAESHLSCHTWPENGYVALDLYTCSDLDPLPGIELLQKTLGARTHLVHDVVRGLVDFVPPVPRHTTQALFDRRAFHTPMKPRATADVDAPRRPHIGCRADAFRANGVVDVTGLVSDDVFAAVRGEALRLLEQHAERRDLRLATTGNTPRYLSVVRSEIVAENSALIRQLYQSRDLLDPLEEIVGEKLIASPKKDEEFLITKHHVRGDTHGWHWGDYRYALIWILEAPAIERGGMLQCVPHTYWDKSNPRIHEWLTQSPIDTYYFSTGQLYLLKTDTTLHRTVPLEDDVTRIILNMTWASGDDLRRPLEGDDRWWDDANVSAAKTDGR